MLLSPVSQPLKSTGFDLVTARMATTRSMQPTKVTAQLTDPAAVKPSRCHLPRTFKMRDLALALTTPTAEELEFALMPYVLAFVVYEPDAPLSFKYGSLGSLFGTSLAELFFANGSWTEVAEEKLHHAITCFLGHNKNSSSLSLLEWDLVFMFTSVQSTWSACRVAQANHGLVHLVNLPYMSRDRLFFFAWCYLKCGDAFREYACNVPLSHSLAFDEAYNCTSGTPMKKERRRGAQLRCLRTISVKYGRTQIPAAVPHPDRRSTALLKQLKEKVAADRGCRPGPLPASGAPVFARNFRPGPLWSAGQVLSPASASSLLVRMPDGNTWQRHADHVRSRPSLQSGAPLRNSSPQGVQRQRSLRAKHQRRQVSPVVLHSYDHCQVRRHSRGRSMLTLQRERDWLREHPALPHKDRQHLCPG
ncbi:hypothetical protein HPB49_025743 [Dermacentor silvarum]|nr:hypothetical protein HPB49_025743 [Dermacentor silvarum]